MQLFQKHLLVRHTSYKKIHKVLNITYFSSITLIHFLHYYYLTSIRKLFKLLTIVEVG